MNNRWYIVLENNEGLGVHYYPSSLAQALNILREQGHGKVQILIGLRCIREIAYETICD